MTRLYTDDAELYDIAFDWDISDEADWLVARLKATRVLEPGCGGGRMLEALADRGCKVAGIDRSTRMVEIARRRLGTRADVMNDNKLKWKFLRGLPRNLSQLIFGHFAMRFILNPVDFASIFKSPHHSPKVVYRSCVATWAFGRVSSDVSVTKTSQTTFAMRSNSSLHYWIGL